MICVFKCELGWYVCGVHGRGLMYCRVKSPQVRESNVTSLGAELYAASVEYVCIGLLNCEVIMLYVPYCGSSGSCDLCI